MIDIDKIKINGREGIIELARNNRDTDQAIWTFLDVEMLDDWVEIDLRRIMLDEDVYIANGLDEKRIILDMNRKLNVLEDEIRESVRKGWL